MKFAKTLSRNDIGANGSHQSGFLVPKTIKSLLDFLPPLDSKELNPSKWIDFWWCFKKYAGVKQIRY